MAVDGPGAEDDELVVRGQFVEAQDRDDVLEVLVALQEALHAAGDAEVAVTDDFRRERGRGPARRAAAGRRLPVDRAVYLVEHRQPDRGFDPDDRSGRGALPGWL